MADITLFDIEDKSVKPNELIDAHNKTIMNKEQVLKPTSLKTKKEIIDDLYPTLVKNTIEEAKRWNRYSRLTDEDWDSYLRTALGQSSTQIDESGVNEIDLDRETYIKKIKDWINGDLEKINDSRKPRHNTNTGAPRG